MTLDRLVFRRALLAMAICCQAVVFAQDAPTAPPRPQPPRALPECETVPPVIPPQALRENISGFVRAQITVREGRVVEVRILKASPPGVFDRAVTEAMLQYRCKPGPEWVAWQTFNFDVTTAAPAK